MCSFVHPSTHSPSSLLATTGYKALCRALGESERHQAYASPSGAPSLEEERRGGARIKTLQG